METLHHCPVCNTTIFTKQIDCKDFTVSKEAFSIVKCNSCNFLFTNPRPEENTIGKYYESDDYISHSGSSKGLVNKIYLSIREYTIRKKIQLIKHSHPTAETILDYGAGTGEFLNAIKKNGFSVHGVEPSGSARKRASGQFDLSLKDQFQPSDFIPGSMDVITMWHVLEHVHRINELMDNFYSLLDSRGKLIIAVPNAASADALFYKEHWAAYDVPRHLYHFSQDTMSRLLSKHNFSIEKIYPMYFDSFYVSMLSEKYKGNTGLFGMMRAFFMGLLSNLKGVADLRFYSSLIYVVKKNSD